MEPHPIPQNVTSFEFHLVGDMTLKQFGYLGAGLGTAYLIYATMFFSIPVLAIPLILISALLGIAFAFVPIYDRPFDHWVAAFFRAVYSPTKGSFKLKSAPKLKIAPNDPILKNRLQLYLSSMGMSVNAWEKGGSAPIPAVQIPQAQPTAPIKEIKESEKQAAQAESLLTKTLDNIQNQKAEGPAQLPSQQELTNLVEMARQAQVLQGKISDTEKLIKQMTVTTKEAETSQVQENLKALLAQTEELYQKTSGMTQATPHAAVTQPIAAPQPVPQAPAPILTQPAVAPKVTIVQPLAHKETQVVLTSTPNVINGIVGDDSGNFLENVIVIIHDKEGMPVRALKTNKLGQFAGATPLPLGIYTITLEKEGFIFQTLQITLDNSVLAPLQIIAKRGGQ